MVSQHGLLDSPTAAPGTSVSGGFGNADFQIKPAAGLWWEKEAAVLTTGRDCLCMQRAPEAIPAVPNPT